MGREGREGDCEGGGVRGKESKRDEAGRRGEGERGGGDEVRVGVRRREERDVSESAAVRKREDGRTCRLNAVVGLRESADHSCMQGAIAGKPPERGAPQRMVSGKSRTEPRLVIQDRCKHVLEKLTKLGRRMGEANANSLVEERLDRETISKERR